MESLEELDLLKSVPEKRLAALRDIEATTLSCRGEVPAEHTHEWIWPYLNKCHLMSLLTRNMLAS